MKNLVLLSFFVLLAGCSKESTLEVEPPKLEAPGGVVSQKELLKLQKAEVNHMKREQKEGYRQAKQLQDQKRKEWEKTEKTARHDYFEKHPKGAERRVYIQDFLKRRDAFFKGLTEELKERERQDERVLGELKKSHAQRKESQDLQSKPN